MAIVGSLLLFSSLFSGQAAVTAPVSLGRVFSKYEKLAYEVRSSLNAQRRGRGLETWLPEDFDLNYDFTLFVEDLKADGIAVVHYQRPYITAIEGETADSPPKENKEKVNMDARLTISPINEVLEMKDLAAKPSKSGKDWMGNANASRSKQAGDVLGQFIQEVKVLSLFAGSIDSSLDLAPKTPFEQVKVGDSWKRTVGYQPQKLQGRGNKQAVQRLDYTFTYKGIVDSEGKKVHRVQGVLDLKTDLAEFLNQATETKSEDSVFKKIPLTLKSTIDFDLDLKTKHTVLVQAKSESGFGIFVAAYPDEALLEETAKGRTTMKLVGDKIIPPVVKKKG